MSDPHATVSDTLKLVALDADDLAVLSAHAQDAVVRAADLIWLPRAKRFALEMRRFDWQAPANAPRRRLAALHFERVAGVRLKGVTPGSEAVLNLLAITFTPGEAPSGTLTLTFAGGAAIALEAECIEAQMADLGPVWEAASRPHHDNKDMT